MMTVTNGAKGGREQSPTELMHEVHTMIANYSPGYLGNLAGWGSGTADACAGVANAVPRPMIGMTKRRRVCEGEGSVS